jgi:cytochrome b involved in lipid metabolism
MSKKVFTLEEIAKHNTDGDLWLCIHGKVYDVTKFQEDHPGGLDTLLEQAGKDATEEFEETFHSKRARDQIGQFFVGDLEGYTGDPDAIHKSSGQVGAGGANSLLIGIPIMIALLAFIYQFVLTE